MPQTYGFFNGADKRRVMLAAMDKTRQARAAQYGSDCIDDWRADLPQHEFVTANYLGIPQAGKDKVLAIGTAMNRGTQSDLIAFKDGKVKVCMVTPPGQSGFISPGLPEIAALRRPA